MFNPQFIFSALWIAQIFLHALFATDFDPIDSTTWVAIFVALIAYNTGAFSVRVSAAKMVDGVRGDLRKTIDINTFFNWFLVIYLCVGIYSAIQILQILRTLSPAELSLPIIRQLVVTDFTQDRVMYGFFRIFFLGVDFSIFILAFSRELSWKKIIIILVIGLFSAVATTGRLYLLLFFCASTILLYRNKKISLRAVIIAAIIFVSLFFVIAVLLSKGAEDSSVMERISWNSKIYFMSSVSCFNNFVVTDLPTVAGGVLLPNPVREIFSYLGVSIPLKPALNLFAFVPMPCNTYTVLFPLFHDGSFFGVAIGMFFVGGLQKILYKRYKFTTNPISWYLHAISIYPVVMSVFEDAYFSSPGFWVLLWIPPICYYLVNRAKIHFYSRDFSVK